MAMGISLGFLVFSTGMRQDRPYSSYRVKSGFPNPAGAEMTFGLKGTTQRRKENPEQAQHRYVLDC
jgi:hypothetical protein